MTEFKRTTVYLIIRADRYMRLAKRPPRLAMDEVAVRLNVAFPATWGQILHHQDVTISLPDFAPAAVEAEIMPAVVQAEVTVGEPHADAPITEP